MAAGVCCSFCSAISSPRWRAEPRLHVPSRCRVLTGHRRAGSHAECGRLEHVCPGRAQGARGWDGAVIRLAWGRRHPSDSSVEAVDLGIDGLQSSRHQPLRKRGSTPSLQAFLKRTESSSSSSSSLSNPGLTAAAIASPEAAEVLDADATTVRHASPMPDGGPDWPEGDPELPDSAGQDAETSPSVSGQALATTVVAAGGRRVWACQVTACRRFLADLGSRASLEQHYRARHRHHTVPDGMVVARQRSEARAPAWPASPEEPAPDGEEPAATAHTSTHCHEDAAQECGYGDLPLVLTDAMLDVVAQPPWLEEAPRRPPLPRRVHLPPGTNTRQVECCRAECGAALRPSRQGACRPVLRPGWDMAASARPRHFSAKMDR